MLFGKKTLDIPTAAQALPGRAQAIPTAQVHFVNGRPLHGPWPEGLEQAVFAMGCFWGVERIFWQIPGVCGQEQCSGPDVQSRSASSMLSIEVWVSARSPTPTEARCRPAKSASSS